jgi:two-component system, LytTR family, response regulator
MSIQCLIIDDEPLAIALIERHLLQFSGYTVAGKCKNVKEAVKALLENRIDLMFLDIHMPEIDGIRFLEEKKNLPPVILTTAYREHALHAFELGVIDYLLKPISFLRFTKAIERFQLMNSVSKVAETVAEPKPLLLKTGIELQKIEPASILYLQSQKDYMNIFTGDKKIMVRSSMSKILQQLPEGEFIQIHKSYIVPVKKILSIGTHSVSLGSIRLPVGQSYRHMLKTKFENL